MLAAVQAHPADAPPLPLPVLSARLTLPEAVVRLIVHVLHGVGLVVCTSAGVSPSADAAQGIRVA